MSLNAAQHSLSQDTLKKLYIRARFLNPAMLRGFKPSMVEEDFLWFENIGKKDNYSEWDPTRIEIMSESLYVKVEIKVV